MANTRYCKGDRLLRAVKYLRISDDREGKELGVTRQDGELDEVAAQLGVVVVAKYCDNDKGASTRSRKPRKDYQRMLRDAKAGEFEVILACTSKRLTRRPREHEDLIDLAEAYGIRYYYKWSPSFDLNTANGRMVARMLAAQDANESEELAERVSSAYKQRVTNGGIGGGGPRLFGRETDGSLRESETVEIRNWSDLVLSDGAAENSLRFIARDLRHRGIPTVGETRRDELLRRGEVEEAAKVKVGPWRPSTVRDILLRPSNAGIRVHRGNGRHPLDEDGNWIGFVGRWEDRDGCRVGPPPIFDEATAKALVARLTAPHRKTSPGNVPRWLGSGIYRCGICGQPDLRVRLSGSKPAPRYRCLAGHVARPAYELDAYVEAHIVGRLSRPDAVDLVAPRRDGVDAAALNREAVTLRQRKDNLATDYADGVLDRAQVKTATAHINARLDDIDRQLAAASGRSPLANIAGRPDAADVWVRLSLARQRAILRELTTVTVMPVGRGRRRAVALDHTMVRIDWATPAAA